MAPPCLPCVRDRYRGFESGHTYIHLNFSLLQSSCLTSRDISSREPWRETLFEGGERRDEKDYLFTLDALSRNLAYFILKSGLLNPE